MSVRVGVHQDQINLVEVQKRLVGQEGLPILSETGKLDRNTTWI
jgi:hypothetical protein